MGLTIRIIALKYILPQFRAKIIAKESGKIVIMDSSDWLLFLQMIVNNLKFHISSFYDNFVFVIVRIVLIFTIRHVDEVSISELWVRVSRQ